MQKSEHNNKFEYVNSKVSWQAKLFNKVVLRGLVKPQVRKLETQKLNPGPFRSFASKLDSVISSQAKGVCVAHKKIDEVNCSWLTVPSQTKRVILYLHGGGFCVHFPKIYDGFVSRLASQLDAHALIPDYRLAPEHTFPSSLDDCVKCYEWLLEQGYSSENILIAGDSAGGQLTLTTLISIRDKHLPAPAAAILISPCTDLSYQGFQMIGEDKDQDPMFVKNAMHVMTNLFLPKGVDLNNPLVSPIYDSLTGLPPIQCHVGSTELLLTHSTRVIENIQKSGNSAKLYVWQEMPHVHPLFTFLPESEEALNLMIGFANEKLG